MAMRGYKLQEFVAHAADVNCVTIGKKSSRIFITGGEDCKVNLWAFGKPAVLLSLSGHTSSVESVAFDSAEILVLGGSSSGIIKLWDVEEAKIVRTLTGHRANCTAVEFHPFGEFFASGSLDTDLKIWDIRKKGCIHTYKGHRGGIQTIRFSPDGRWVVTGGADNMVKLWDLTAGKLLHDFKFHNGLVQCMNFHPHELLLATGSADRTVKFWDLETFELIGSAGPEVTGVHSMIFHPDGKTLFCGLDLTLKVFSWEPVRCHDIVDMEWSTLGDLSIYQGKLLGCSLQESRVGVWVADISLIGPYALGVIPRPSEIVETTFIHENDLSVELKESHSKSTLAPGAEYQNSGSKIIDTTRTTNLNSHAVLSSPTPSALNAVRKNKLILSSPSSSQRPDPKIPSETSLPDSAPSSVVKAIQCTPSSANKTQQIISSRNNPFSTSAIKANSSVSLKKSATKEIPSATDVHSTSLAISMPVVVPREKSQKKQVSDTCKVITSVTPHGALLKPTHLRRQSLGAGFSKSKFLETPSRPLSDMRKIIDNPDSNFSRLSTSCNTSDVDGLENISSISITQKFEAAMSVEQPLQPQNDNNAEPPCSSSETSSVTYVRGVAVQPGKIRSLVESWEHRERCHSNNLATKEAEQTFERDLTTADVDLLPEILMRHRDPYINALKSRLTKLQVVRHFWGQDGIKGAINAVAKLPDHSVQVDVVSILKDKIDHFTLDLFLTLLPLLAGLLSSKIERHITVSLGMLLELVKIFIPVIRSTLSASSTVGIDLQAEQRLERCTQCFKQLEKIKRLLPPLIRRGGLIAKHAGELSIVLQDI